jgi:hypothetical protein
MATGALFNLRRRFSSLSIPTIKRGARLAVCGVVVIDECGKFRELILKPSVVARGCANDGFGNGRATA